MFCNHGNKLSLRCLGANLQHPDHLSEMVKERKAPPSPSAYEYSTTKAQGQQVPSRLGIQGCFSLQT